MHRPIASAVMSLGRRLRSGGLIASVARQGAGMLAVRVTSLAILFGVQALLARLLGVDQFGIVLVALAVVGVLQLFARQGFEIAASRFVGLYCGLRQWDLLRGFLNASRIAVSGGAVLLAAALCLFTLLFGGRLGADMLPSLWLAAAILPVFTLLQLEAAVVRGLGHTAISDIPTWIVHPVVLGAGVAAAILIAGSPARAATVLWVYLVAAVGTLAVQHVVMHRFLPRPVTNARPQYRWNEWMKAAPAMMLFAGTAMLFSQVNTIILGSFSTTSEAAIYSVAVRIAGVMQLITFCFIAAVGPVASRLHAEGKLGELEHVVAVGARVVFAAVVLAVAVLAVAGKLLLSVFGPEFVAGYGAMMVLAAGHSVWAATVPAGVLLNMTGHHNVSARILLGAAVVNLLLCAALVPAHGSMGAAIATAVSIALWNGLMAVVAGRRVGIRAHVRLGRRKPPVPAQATR